MILIAYDDSDDAKAAVQRAAELFPGQRVTVLSVWQRFIDTMARVGGGLGVVIDMDEIDRANEQAAQTLAQGGVELANAAGLQAQARTAVVESSVAEAILHQATLVNASAVVCGSRGHTGLRSLMLGSVSQSLLHHADLPVVVVPSPEVARARAEHREGLQR